MKSKSNDQNKSYMMEPCYLIEHASNSFLITIMMIALFFFAVSIYCILFMNFQLKYEYGFKKLNPTKDIHDPEISKLYINFNIDHLTSDNLFFTLYIKLYRGATYGLKRDNGVSITVNEVASSNEKPDRLISYKIIEDVIEFDVNEKNSSKIIISKQMIKDFDSIHIHLSGRTEVKGIEGYYYTWKYVVADNCERARYMCLLFSALLVYLLGSLIEAFMPNLSFFTQISCVGLGIISLFAVNPFSPLLHRETAAFIEAFSIPLFYSFFQLFVIMQLHLLIIRNMSPSRSFMFLITIWFIIAGTVNGICRFNQFKQMLKTQTLQNHKNNTIYIILGTNFINTVIGAFFVINVMVQTLLNDPKSVYFTFLLFLQLFQSWIYVICITKGKYISFSGDMLSTSMFVILSGLTIFLLHPSEKVIANKVHDDEQPLVVDQDQ